eukprot:4511706-Amphidinium_carterae.1
MHPKQQRKHPLSRKALNPLARRRAGTPAILPCIFAVIDVKSNIEKKMRLWKNDRREVRFNQVVTRRSLCGSLCCLMGMVSYDAAESWDVKRGAVTGLGRR